MSEETLTENYLVVGLDASAAVLRELVGMDKEYAPDDLDKIRRNVVHIEVTLNKLNLPEEEKSSWRNEVVRGYIVLNG